MPMVVWDFRCFFKPAWVLEDVQSLLKEAAGDPEK